MRRFSLALAFTILSIFAVAQAPNMFSYQAVARDNAGLAVANKLLKVRFSIIDISSSGTILYSEIHSPTTTLTGLFSLNVGAGTPETGSFAAIDWSSGAKFLKTEVDMTGQGTTYSLYGTTQLISVPYALYAEKSGNSGGSSIWTETGNTASYTGKVEVGDEIHVKSFATFDTTVTSPDIRAGWLRANQFYLPNGAGNGKVLTSDGSGIASWQTPVVGNSQDTILKVRNSYNGSYFTIGKTNEFSDDTTRFEINTNGNYLKISSNDIEFNAGTIGGTVAGINLNTIYGSNISATDDIALTPSGRVRLFGSKPVTTTQDIYITQATKGVVMKSPNGSCWRMTVSDAGAPQFNSITCP